MVSSKKGESDIESTKALQVSFPELTADETALISSTATVHDFLQLVKAAQESWKSKKRAGIRHAVQKTMTNWATFAEAYAPSVQALTSAKSEVGLVWGLFGLVVTVVKNKEVKEQTMNDFVVTLSETMPRFDFYKRLYPTKRILECVKELNDRVIEFLKHVWNYYRGMRWKRVASAIFDPPEKTIKPLVDGILATCQKIKDEGLVALSAEVRVLRQNIVRMEGTVDDVSRRVGSIEADVKGASLSAAKKELERIRPMLVGEEYDPDLGLRKFRATLAAIPQTLTEAQDLDRLETSSVTQRWRDDPTARSILWVTPRSMDHRQDVWLSNFANRIQKGLQRQQVMVAHSFLEENTTGKMLFKQLVFQRLQQNPLCLCAKNSFERFHVDGTTSLHQLASLAGDACNEWPSFWIVDRIDRLDFSVKAGRFEKFFEALETLARSGTIKVLITSRCLPEALDKMWDIDDKERMDIIEVLN
jgi:hypothetical protein